MTYPIKNLKITFDFSNVRQPIKNTEREEFLKNYPTIDKGQGLSSLSLWLGKKAKRDDLLTDFIRYCKITDLKPQDLYNLNEKYGDTFSEELLEAFQIEAEKVFGIGSSRISDITSSVKSFYRFCGRGIQKGRGVYGFTRKGQKPRFNKEELFKFAEEAQFDNKFKTIQFKAMVATLSTIPVRDSAFLKFKWKEVKEVLEGKELPQIIVPFEYQKRSIKKLEIYQTSFVHSWAEEKILLWKEEYEKLTKRKIDVKDLKSLDYPMWISVIKPYGKMGLETSERMFRVRSKETPNPILPKDLRTFFNTNLRCENEGLRKVMMAQSGEYNGSYIMEGNAQFEILKKDFERTEQFINPLYEEELEKKKQKARQTLKSKGLSENQIKEIEENFSMRFISMDS